jgi:hypothetical protein
MRRELPFQRTASCIALAIVFILLAACPGEPPLPTRRSIELRIMETKVKILPDDFVEVCALLLCDPLEQLDRSCTNGASYSVIVTPDGAHEPKSDVGVGFQGLEPRTPSWMCAKSTMAMPKARLDITVIFSMGYVIRTLDIGNL